jgi:hypothetical protein
MFPLTKEMRGGKSWIELPGDFAAHPSRPVLDDCAFAGRLAQLRAVF